MSGNLIFIDFEACSLSEDGWPIEIGFAWINDSGKLGSSSKLIKPHPLWPATAWSERSERVHGISRRDLKAAEEAQDVAQWVDDQIDGARILSDAAEHDGRWLCCLMATIGRGQKFKVSFIQKEAHSYFQGAAISMFYKAHANGRSQHRAASDALDLAQAWRAALRKQEKVKKRGGGC